MEPLNQLNTEWVLINASKEALSILKKKNNVTYKDAIKFAKENSKDLFENSKTGLLKRTSLEKIYDKYTQEAKAKSQEKKVVITQEDLINERIFEINKLLSFYPQNDDSPEDLKKERILLEKVLRSKHEIILNLEKITENQAILNDSFVERASKVLINKHLGKANTYLDKENGTIFKVNILHPNPSEAIIGADLIYEQYDTYNQRVRIAAIQYKIWEDGVLYISNSGNILNQINKMKNCFCDNKFCDSPYQSSPIERFRFPHCAAFLRPTDKLQDPNKLITTGYHVPICCINQLQEMGVIDYKIDLESIRKATIKSLAFEELFNSGMIGSDWVKVHELQSFYRQTKVLEPNQNIIFYAQSVSPSDLNIF